MRQGMAQKRVAMALQGSKGELTQNREGARKT